MVETIGFRDDLWLDAAGNPLTEQGKMTERIRRPNYGNLEVEITINDPKAYTAPWTVKINQPLVLDSELVMVGGWTTDLQQIRVLPPPLTRPPSSNSLV